MQVVPAPLYLLATGPLKASETGGLVTSTQQPCGIRCRGIRLTELSHNTRGLMFSPITHNIRLVEGCSLTLPDSRLLFVSLPVCLGLPLHLALLLPCFVPVFPGLHMFPASSSVRFSVRSSFSSAFMKKTDPKNPPKLVVVKYEDPIRTDELPEETETFWVGEDLSSQACLCWLWWLLRDGKIL